MKIIHLYASSSLICLFLLLGVVHQYRPKERHEVTKVGLNIGNVAPEISLTDIKGKQYVLSQQREHNNILVFFCGCNRCHEAARLMAKMQHNGELANVTAVVALSPEDTRLFVRQAGLSGNIMADPSDSTAEKYDSTDCPRVWIICMPNRIIRYRSGTNLEKSSLRVALEKVNQEMARDL